MTQNRRPHMFLLPKLLATKEVQDNIPLRFTLSSLMQAPFAYMTSEEYDQVYSMSCTIAGNYDAFLDLSDDIKNALYALHFPMLAITLAGYEITAVHFHNPDAYQDSAVLGDSNYTDSYLSVDLESFSFTGNNLSQKDIWSEIEPFGSISASDYQAAVIFEMRPRSYLNGFIDVEVLDILGTASANPNIVIGTKGIGLLLQTQPEADTSSMRPGGALKDYVRILEEENTLMNYSANMDDVSDLFNSTINQLSTAWADLYQAYDAYMAQDESSRNMTDNPIYSRSHGLLPMLLPDSWVVYADEPLQQAALEKAVSYAYQTLKDEGIFFRFDYPYKDVNGYPRTFGDYVSEGYSSVKNTAEDQGSVGYNSLFKAIQHCFTSVFSGYEVVASDSSTDSPKVYLPESLIDDWVGTYHYIETVMMLQEFNIINSIALDDLEVSKPEWTTPDITGFFEEIPLDNSWDTYRDQSPDIATPGTLFSMEYTDTLQINQAGRGLDGWFQGRNDGSTPYAIEESRLISVNVSQSDREAVFTLEMYEPDVNFNSQATSYDEDGTPSHPKLSTLYTVFARHQTLEDIGLGDWVTALNDYSSDKEEITADREFVVLEFYDYSPDQSYTEVKKRFIQLSADPFLSNRHLMSTDQYSEMVRSSQQAPFHSIEKANLFIAVYRLIYHMEHSYPSSMDRGDMEDMFASDIAWLWNYGDPETERLEIASIIGLNIYASYDDAVSRFNALINMTRDDEGREVNTIREFFMIEADTSSYTYEEGDDPWLRHYEWWEKAIDISLTFEIEPSFGPILLGIQKNLPEDELWDDTSTASPTDPAYYIGGSVGIGWSNIFGYPTEIGATIFEDSSDPELHTWLCTRGNWSPWEFTGTAKNLTILNVGFTFLNLDWAGGSAFPLNGSLFEITVFESYPRKIANALPLVEKDYKGYSIGTLSALDIFNVGWGVSRTRKFGAAIGATLASVSSRHFVCAYGWGYNDEVDRREEIIREIEENFPVLLDIDFSVEADDQYFFAVDSYALTDYAQWHLREFVTLYRHEFEDPESMLTIKGHCDRTASYDYNYRLSRRRAAAVLQFFYDVLGPDFRIKQNNIVIDGFGETEAAGDELPDETDAPYYRRVDVTLNGRTVIKRADDDE